jgi:4-carboxymuconolactone decarboxylase
MMRARLLLLCALAVAVNVTGQAPKLSKDNLGLVGDRFAPLTYDQMTPEQKKMIDHLLSGERTNLGGPFNVLLRSPEMGDLAQQFGASMRFHAALPVPARETVIIVTARYWGAQFEWTAHKRAALEAGVPTAVVDAIANGKRPAGMTPDVEAAYNFTRELLKTKQVSDGTFAAAKGRFGERGVVDMIALNGWYSMVSMALNVDRYPVAQAELKAMENPLP